MSGFVVFVDFDSTSLRRENAFQGLLQSTAQFKRLSVPTAQVIGQHCTAAKLDSPASLHRGIIRDSRTESWLLAAGTIITLAGDNDPLSLLQILLQDYLERGAQALERYDGHFALAIYDGRDDSLSAISDPAGQFSIFCGVQGGRTYLSTSALAVAKQTQAPPDTLTLECFLRTGRVHGERTFWQGVKRLLPATVQKISRGKMESCEYWSPTYDQTIARLKFEEAQEQALLLLTTTFQRLLHREGEVWADLTGGFDTRMSAMLMDKVGIPFTAYCVGPAGHPDVRISQTICEAMGWEYRHMPLPDNWEQAQLAWLEVALQQGDARLGVFSLAGVVWGQEQRSAISKVTVTGLGADEWREVGYPGQFRAPWGKTFACDQLMDVGILSPIPLAVMRQDHTQAVRDDWRTYLMRLAANYADLPNVTKSSVIFARYRYSIHGGAYMSAVAGVLRALSPFCFKAPISFALSMDYRWRINFHAHFIRTLLETVNPRLANIPTAHGGPAVPMRITNLYKFWPIWKKLVNRAIEGTSRKYWGKPVTLWPGPPQSVLLLPTWRMAFYRYAHLEGLLKPAEMASEGLYNTVALQALVEQGLAGTVQYGEFLDRVITIEMAMRAVGTSVS